MNTSILAAIATGYVGNLPIGNISSCHTHARPGCFDLCSPQQASGILSLFNNASYPTGVVLGSCQGAQHLDQQAADLWLPTTCLKTTHACHLTRPTPALATAFGMLQRPSFPTLDSHLHMPECMASCSRRVANWGYKSLQEKLLKHQSPAMLQSLQRQYEVSN